MSIQILTESHAPHLTASTVSVVTKYIMDTNDFYNGFGRATLCDGTLVNANFILPSIGMKYVQYYFLPQLVGYWQDVVLGDITSEKTSAHDFGSIDNSSWDLDKKIVVTYSWSNTAKKDIITANDQSSIRFDITTNTQLETTDLIIQVGEGGTIRYAPDVFFTQTNPDIIFYSTDDDGNPKSTNKGPYNSASESFKRYHRDNNESPAHEKYTTQTVLTVTLYSKNNYFFLLSDSLNKINSVDFMANPYSKREQRLQEKGRSPTFQATDIATQDDSGKWLFYDYTKTESGIDLYKYEMFFLYKHDQWVDWFGAEVDEYLAIDMYAVLLNPMFNTGI